MEITKCEAETIRIYIAGSRHLIEDACKEFCNQIGYCVSVKEANFIYTGGSESGFEITIINYARFPADYDFHMERATALAKKLIDAAYQKSCSIVSSKESLWISKHIEAAS